MSDTPNVFLSWSGPRARAMAEALHGFLRRVIQSARPFHSDKDIAAGDFGDPEIRAALKTVVFAIVCCTPENVTAPWLNYEAGAIAERLEGCTAPLILGSKPEALDRSPIFRLQAREADKSGTLFVVQSLNAKLPQPLPDDILTEAFDTHWVKLEETWRAIPAPATTPPSRDPKDMLEEVVGLCRQIALNGAMPAREFDVHISLSDPQQLAYMVERAVFDHVLTHQLPVDPQLVERLTKDVYGRANYLMGRQQLSHRSLGQLVEAAANAPLNALKIMNARLRTIAEGPVMPDGEPVEAPVSADPPSI